jgi:hypothetical protein
MKVTDVTFAAHREWCTCEEISSRKKSPEFTYLDKVLDRIQVCLFCNAPSFCDAAMYQAQGYSEGAGREFM